ncbi:hypothetical protein ABZ896_51210, partial [Streptomyces sp. NPDC047072]
MNARPQVLVRGPGLCLRDLRQGPLLWLVRTPETGVPLDISVLDAHERRRAAALRRPAERALYVAAHGALRRVLGAYAGLSPAAVRLARQSCPACGGPHGRPVLSGPAGRALHFSLGYSAGLALHRHSALIRYSDSNCSQDTNPTPNRHPASKVS